MAAVEVGSCEQKQEKEDISHRCSQCTYADGVIYIPERISETDFCFDSVALRVALITRAVLWLNRSSTAVSMSYVYFINLRSGRMRCEIVPCCGYGCRTCQSSPESRLDPTSGENLLWRDNRGLTSTVSSTTLFFCHDSQAEIQSRQTTMNTDNPTLEERPLGCSFAFRF